MNNLELSFPLFTVVVNVGVRLVTAFIFLAFLIPLIFREAQVKNGLKVLRVELLLTGLLIFLINTVGLLIILFRYLGANVQLATDIISYFNTFGFLAYALIKLKIYTQNYSAESKARHERYDKQEKRWQEKKESKAIRKKKP